MPAIEVSHLTKEYRLGALQGLKQTLLDTGARLLGKHIPERPLFKALDDVSFTIEQGEVVGIIGHNGAGKSTLLKMLARISTPTRGSVQVNGRIAPLIEVGAGFVPDFTGRENVYLNGSILGLSKKEIDKKFDEIVDFAEIADFIDTPVKRYSSGMQVKLAFAVATSVDSEILIVDEVLAVGDLAFQRKCFDRMEEMILRHGKTVLLVSHNIRQVERLCNRSILLSRGHIVADGNAKDVCNAYYEQSDEKIHTQAAQTGNSAIQGSGELELLGASLLNDEGQAVSRIEYKSTATFRIRFRCHAPLKDLAFGVGVHTPDMIFVANDDSLLSHRQAVDLEVGEFELVYKIADMPLLPGTYALRVGVALKATDRTVFYGENLAHFQILSSTVNRSRTVGQGFFSLDGTWSFSPAA